MQQELEMGRSQEIDVPDLSTFTWAQVVAVTSEQVPNVIDLGRGEAEVIAVGLEHSGSLLILDDQLGRRIASFYKLKYTGTLGVLNKAKQAGYLPNIA